MRPRRRGAGVELDGVVEGTAQLDPLVRLCALDGQLRQLESTEAVARRRLGELRDRQALFETSVEQERRHLEAAEPQGPAHARNRLAELERELSEFTGRVESLAKELEDRARGGAERARLERERLSVMDGLPADLAAAYQSLVGAARHPAVAPVEGSSCSGCHLRLPPQMANRIRQSPELMRCPHCHRFVYDPMSGVIRRLHGSTPEPGDVVDALRAGACVSDADFDSMYRPAVRELSRRHFTPVAVARRAAELLVTGPDTRVLDVGSGAGKFCLVGALTTGGSFHGIERARDLVDAARRVALLQGVARTHFIHGDLASLNWAGFTAFYLYNPFPVQGGEHLALTPADCAAYIELVRTRLAERPPGTRVVTYHGFGGNLPRGYRLVQVEGQGADLLELWIKESWPGAS